MGVNERCLGDARKHNRNRFSLSTGRSERFISCDGMDWKETVTSLSDRVFPGLSHKIEDKLMESEVMSNLPLQMSLYFNVVFSPIWLLTTTLYIYDKYSGCNELYKFVLVTTVTGIFLIEAIRLYLGYAGNLGDKIPELAGFWMLSVLLQLPLQGFLLLNPHFELRITEYVIQSVMFILLTTQLASGYSALKYTATKQATYFRIMKLRSECRARNTQDLYKVK